jgi:hypothetical protein
MVPSASGRQTQITGFDPVHRLTHFQELESQPFLLAGKGNSLHCIPLVISWGHPSLPPQFTSLQLLPLFKFSFHNCFTYINLAVINYKIMFDVIDFFLLSS